MDMKKIFVLAMCLAAAAACTNLDEQLYSKIAKENFFTSEEQFAKYSARAYSTLQHWGTEKSYWSFDFMVTDEACTPINPIGWWDDEGRYREVQTHDIPNTNVLLEQAWVFCFNGIAACNDVLDTFAEVQRDFEGKNRVVAEIKVLRAYYYFMAICYWQYVPFATTKKMEGYPQKKDRAFIFNWIEQEITENIDHLAVQPTKEYYGRVTRGVADFLLAKLYLNAEFLTGTPRWADAEAACKDIMTANNGSSWYKIVKNYKSIFAIKNEMNEEGIMAIPYSTVYTTSDHYAFLIYISTLPVDLCEPLGIAAEAWDGIVAQPDFFASYEDGDKRKNWTWLYGQMQDLSGNNLTIKIQDPDNAESTITVPYVIDPYMPEEAYTTHRTALQGARIQKWDYQSDMTLTGGQVGMENDFYIMRYADVVLMYLESLLRQNKTTAEEAAITDFDKIRDRAGLSAIAFADLTLEKLYQERSHELALEGWHRQDMIRFGKYLGSWWNKPVTGESDYNLPIPKSAKAANPNL